MVIVRIFKYETIYGNYIQGEGGGQSNVCTECLGKIVLHQELSVFSHLSQIGQPIEENVHSHCVENFEDLLKRYVGEGGVPVDFS